MPKEMVLTPTPKAFPFLDSMANGNTVITEESNGGMFDTRLSFQS
jgi:hypothetical protein